MIFSVSLITAAVIWITDLNQTGGYLNMTPKQREKSDRNPLSIQTEREQLLSGNNAGSTDDLSSEDMIQTQSNSQLKSHYLTQKDDFSDDNTDT